MNIYDIPIALITQQYLDTIHLMQELNLDVAGEFLVMAATLIHIKSKMLLPRPETAAGVEGDEEDPRDALVRRLLEHQKFKAAAGCCTSASRCARRSGSAPTSASRSIAGDDYEPELEVDLFSLLTAFQAVVAARQAAAQGAAAARADAGRESASSSCSRGSRRPRPAASRICLPTSTIAAG